MTRCGTFMFVAVCLSAVCAGSAVAAEGSCETPELLLCENFEEGAVGEAPSPDIWKLQLGEGSAIAVDDATAAQGQRSARVTVSQDRKWAYLQTRSIFLHAERRMWGRMYFNIRDERPADEGLVHWNLIEAMSGQDPIRMYRYGGISVPELGRNYFNWNHEMRPRPEGFNELSQDDEFSARVPTGEWVCVEWMFNADNEESRFFWDGVARPALHVVGSAGGVAFDMEPFRALNIGFTIYQPIKADWVVWIDEIAVGLDRIGCLN